MNGEAFEIPNNVYCVDEYLVAEEHIASHIGSGDVGVLSTPSMIAFMERTSMKCIQRYLPSEYTTVGTLVNIRHLNPAPIGATVRVESKLISRENRKLIFEVRAFHEDLVIGEGVHERFIVNKEKFLEKLRKIISK